MSFANDLVTQIMIRLSSADRRRIRELCSSKDQKTGPGIRSFLFDEIPKLCDDINFLINIIHVLSKDGELTTSDITRMENIFVNAKRIERCLS